MVRHSILLVVIACISWLSACAIPSVNAPNLSEMEGGTMNNEKLGRHLSKHHKGFSGQPGFWVDESGSRKVYIMTDETHNRMRVMTPIQPITDTDENLTMQCLEANFDRALDARYAVNEGVLWAAFLHPLKSLTISDLDNAILQVVTLADNTGRTFQSSDLTFGGGASVDEDEVGNGSKGTLE